jgi:hypothetical protein
MKQKIRISFLSVWILVFAAAYFKADVSLYKKGLPASLFCTDQ